MALSAGMTGGVRWWTAGGGNILQKSENDLPHSIFASFSIISFV